MSWARNQSRSWAKEAEAGSGPARRGMPCREAGLPDSFDPARKEKGNVLWTQPYGGRSAPLVLDGKLYLINGAGDGLEEGERVMCFDEKTGKPLWSHKFNVFHTDIVSVRLGWTNLAGDPETGNVYAHGTQGFLFCFNRDGKVLWQHSLTEEYGRISGYGGRLTSPVVDGDLVVISMLNASWGEYARGGCRFVAFDKNTGAVVWWASTGLQPKDTYYSCPVVADVPFVARRSRRDPAEVRRRFGLPGSARLVLASFGGYGLKDIDLGRLASLDGWTVVTTSNVHARRRDPEPDARAHAASANDMGTAPLPATVRFVDEREIYNAGYRYEDIVAAVDVVATKPGYGIIAECVANDTAMIYTSRGRFVEYEVLVREMPKYLRTAFISNEDLYAGRWQEALDAVVAQPDPPVRPRVDGAEVVARRLVERLPR